MSAVPSARSLARDALVRIERDGAYANLLVPSLLDRSQLERRDRAFVTELVYGATRMRRALDWLVDRFLHRDPDPVTRAVLRLGAYQLVWLDTPAHAAVSATVAVAPARTKGLGQRRAAQGEPGQPGLARRGHPIELPGLDHRATHPGPGSRRGHRRARIDERVRVGGRTRRWLPPGHRLSVGDRDGVRPGRPARDRPVRRSRWQGHRVGRHRARSWPPSTCIRPGPGWWRRTSRKLGSPHLMVVAGDGCRPPLRDGTGRAGPGRRAVLGSGLVAPSARRPLAHRARRRRPPGDVAARSAGRGPAAAPSGRRARLLRCAPSPRRRHWASTGG